MATTPKKTFGVGTDDLYGVQEAEGRRVKAKEKAQAFQDMETQNIFTELNNRYQNSRSNWANTHKTARENYQQQEFDFAGATDLKDYYNDTAGAYHGGKRKNKFGKKDYEYLKNMGASDDVINKHIAGLGFNNLHENFRNNDLASHIHANGWNSGTRFNSSDMDYVKDNNLNMVDEIMKYGKRRSGKSGMGYGYLSGSARKQLEEAGKLKEYDAMFARGHTSEGGLSSYDQGKSWNGQDLGYLRRQGYGNEDIMKHMASTWHADGDKKGTKVNRGVANWLNKTGQIDEYTRLTRGMKNGQLPGGGNTNTITNTETNTSTNTVNNTEKATSDSSVNANVTDTITNNVTQNIGNKGDMTTSFGNNATISNSQIGNDHSQNTGTINLDNNIDRNMNVANQSQANTSASFDLQGFKKSLKEKMGGGLNFSEFQSRTADDYGGLNFDRFKTNPYMNGGGFNLNQSQSSS